MKSYEPLQQKKFTVPDINNIFLHSNDNISPMKPRNKKFKFNYEDDQKLIALVNQYNRDTQYIDWNRIAQEMGNRTARQCKERWTFYLSPEVNNGPFTLEEDRILMEKYNEIGSKWSTISQNLKNRTPTCVKNRVLSILRNTKRNEEFKMNKKMKFPMMHIHELISLIPNNQQNIVPYETLSFPILTPYPITYIPPLISN